MFYLISQIFLCLLIAALLGAVVGWLLRHLIASRQIEELEVRANEADRAWQKVKDDLAQCRGELEKCRKSGSKADADDAAKATEADAAKATKADEKADEEPSEDDAKATEADAGSVEADTVAVAPLADLSAADDGEPPAKDDLTKIEGIGPKIQGLLGDAGIFTWRQLSETPVADLQAILDKAGSRYQVHDPGTWPQQAGLAADGKWDELDELQDNLKGGREG